jgi:hypothetical protein
LKKFGLPVFTAIIICFSILVALTIIFFVGKIPIFQQLQLKRTAPQGQDVPSLPSSDAPATIVYGLWTKENSEIFAVNSDGSNHLLLASLPKNFKDVHVLSKNELLYLADVDTRDHGQALKVYNLISGIDQTVYTPPFGYGIDDIVLSSDKTKVATWEVQFKPGSNILAGGTSQVRMVNLKTKVDETIVPAQKAGPDSPTHYPRLFNHAGTTLYTDLFAANGGGVGFGLTAWNLETKKGSEVAWLSEGEYAHELGLHPKKDLLVYRTHAMNPKSIFLTPPEGMTDLEADRSPNALATLDLVSGEKQTIPITGTGLLERIPLTNPNGSLIATWEYHIPLPEEDQEGGSFVRVFNLDQQTSQSLNPKASFDEESPVPLAWLDNITLLVSLDVPNQTQFVGNLGENYYALVGKFATMTLGGKITPLFPALSEPQNAQFIEVVAKATNTPSFFASQNLKVASLKSSRYQDFRDLTFRVAQQWGPPPNKETSLSFPEATTPAPPAPTSTPVATSTATPAVQGVQSSQGLVLGIATTAYAQEPQCLAPPGCFDYCEADIECISGNCVPSLIPSDDPRCQALAEDSSCQGCSVIDTTCTDWISIPGGQKRSCTIAKKCLRPKSCSTGCICQNNKCINPANPENTSCLTLECEAYPEVETYDEVYMFPGCYEECQAGERCLADNCRPHDVPLNTGACQWAIANSSCRGNCTVITEKCGPWYIRGFEDPRGGLWGRDCTVTKKCLVPKRCYVECACQDNKCVNPANPENRNCIAVECDTQVVTDTYTETSHYDSPLYLYPEKPTKVGIYLPVKPVWSKPVYQDGWYLTAYPDGDLVMVDGSQPPYLAYSSVYRYPDGSRIARVRS